MKYVLPNEEIIDLGIYTTDDCKPLDSETINQEELSKFLFEQTGILIATMEGGENNE